MSSDNPSASGTAAPKKSFFKKGAWRNKVKDESGSQTDIFSHSDGFKDIVAEKIRQRREEEARKKAEEEAHKQQQLEASLASSGAKRKASPEFDDDSNEENKPKTPKRGHKRYSRDRDASPDGDQGHSSRTLSDSPVALKLSASYNSITQSAPTAKIQNEVVELSDGSNSSDEEAAAARTSTPPARKTEASPLPSSLVKQYSFSERWMQKGSAEPPPPSDSEDNEADDDPLIQEIKARARGRRLFEQDVSVNPDLHDPREPPIVSVDRPGPIVDLLITADTIPNTKPLVINVRTTMTLEKARQAWCHRNNLSENNIFLTWKKRRLLDSTQILRLGISQDKDGLIHVAGDKEVYSEDFRPQIHLEGWTEETWHAQEKQKRKDSQARSTIPMLPRYNLNGRFSPSAPASGDDAEETKQDAEPKKKGIVVTLRAKGYPDYKTRVYNETTFEEIVRVYHQKREFPATMAISLFFDGERLRPMDAVRDTDLESHDVIEVHFS